MNSIDKKAYKLGLIAAAFAAVIPLLLQATLTAAPIAANVA
jgi:hypothetical protein